MDSAGGQNEGEHRVRGDGARLLQPWHSRARGARSLLSDRGMSWSNKNGVPCTISLRQGSGFSENSFNSSSCGFLFF
jgi:hypothetical protein